jgi:hypothetical protein
MSPVQTRGLLLGLVLGIVWMWLGFGAALLTAGLGLLGWLIGTVMNSLAARNMTLVDVWNGLQGRRAAS